MNFKEFREQSHIASPSGFLINQQPSEMSYNPSLLKQQSQRTQSGLKKSSHLKNRLKFETVKQNDMAEVMNMINDNKSQQNIQLEFHLSDCLKKMNQLFKSRQYEIFYIVMLVVFMVNCIIEATLINIHVEQITNNIDFGLQIFFTVTILIKFTQFQKLQIFWISIDILTNISGYLSYGMKEFQQPVRYLRAVKTLRILLLVKKINYLKRPATKLIKSLSSVGKILFPAALFIYFYAVIGLYSFRDYEYSKCRSPANKFLTSNWTVYKDQIFLCGQKSCPLINGVQYECLNPIDYGVQPDYHEVKNMIQGNGLMRYNNIFFSLFSTFKQTFITGSSRLMILGKQVTNYFYVLIYYLSFIYLLAYIYLNIFYGLLITNEQESKDITKESMFQLRLNRVSQKKITYKSQTEKKKIQEKEMDGLSFQPVFKKTSSNSQVQNLESCNQMIRQDNIDIQQVQEFQNTYANQIPIKQNKNSLIQSNKEKNIIQSQKVVGFESFDEKTTQQNLLKYGQIMKKYYLINHVIVILCSLNILIDWQGQTYNEKLIIDTIDFVFFWVYMLEMIFRFFIHKIYVPKQPIDRAGKLDFFVFLLCACGQTYEVATAQDVHHFLMASDDISRLLRTIKYLRIFLLISSTPYFKQARIIFNAILQAVYSVRYFSALWLLILLIFSIMGLHMFQGKATWIFSMVTHNILDLRVLWTHLFTQFLSFSTNNGIGCYFSNTQVNLFFIVIWVLIVLVIGLQVLSKYFMALLMKELGDRLNQQEEIEQQQSQDVLQNKNDLKQIFMNNQLNQNKILPTKNNPSSYTFKVKQKQLIQNQEYNDLKNSSYLKRSKLGINPSNRLLDVKNQINEQCMRRQKQKKLSIIRDMILKQCQQQNKSSKSYKKSRASNKVSNKFYQNTEFGGQEKSISWIENKRIKFTVFLKSKFFKATKVLFIIISIISTLAMNPLNDPNSETVQTYTKIWYATIVFFGIQILISIFAFGPFNQKSGYFRSIMNWIYLFVFIIEIISVIQGLSKNTHLESILSFRIFRIFVFIELKYEADADMRLTMVSFWKLLPKVLNLLAITVIMYGFFAIILVKLYKDDYYYCDGYLQNANIETQKDCMNWGGSWVQRKLNVSNIFKSLLYLFLLATTEGWSTQVIESASIAGQGNEPQYGENIWIQYFFSVFFFLGNLIMLNVFIGLSVYNFQKIKSQVTGLSRLLKNDKMWFSIKNTIHRLSPKMKDTPPENIISQLVHKFKNSSTYKIINVIFFIFFMINMSLYTTNMSDQKQKILDTIITIFVGIFIFEYLIQWIALGLRVIKHKKFIFETIGVVYFIIVFGLDYGVNLEPKLDRILHGIIISFLAIRYFTSLVLNDVEFIRKMINSLLSVFPQTYNIWLLIFLTLFTYAVIGIYFFGYLKISPQLNEFDQNYTDLKSSIYALIKFSTMQSPILQIVDSTSKIEPNSVCFSIQNYDDFVKYGRMGCGNSFGYVFFLSFLIIYSMILMSTLLAVIVDAYSQVRREQESMVNKFQLEEVQKQWQNYDPQATGYIGYRDFWIFTAKLVKIYKVNKQELLSHETKQSFLKSLQIPIYQDQNGVLSFQFHEVVEALTRIVLKQKMGPDWNTSQADKVFKNHHDYGFSGKLFKKSVYDSSHVLTLIVMKSGLKAWKRKAVNTQNQQKIQNLFTITKKDNNKPENVVQNNFNQNDNFKLVQKGIQHQNEISLSKNPKNELNSSSGNEKKRMKKSIQRIDFQTLQKQQKDKQKVQQRHEQLFENNHSKSPRMGVEKLQKKQARKILISSEAFSKVKTSKDNIKNVQSDRLKQNLNFVNKENKSNQDDQMSQLQQIK